MINDRLSYLFDRYRINRCTPEELQELYLLCLLPENQSSLEQLAESVWADLPSNEDMPVAAGEDILQRILQLSIQKPIANPAKLRRIGWRRIAVAASLFIAIGLGSYFLFFNNSKHATVATIETQAQRFKNDIEPGQYKAKLTLADGSTIVLDSAAPGELATQGNTIILNKDGKLVYRAASATPRSDELVYNTLTTAKGETYVTVLADGSKVWLNSGSSIKFPVAFTDNERRVAITGEAYFEVQHNVAKPFIVSVNGMEVHDLGTAFNINAYSDEAIMKTTLVSGKAEVVNGTAKQLLTPGQQAQAKSSGELSVVNNADIQLAIAWKNGVFLLNGSTIETVMRQVARWYDIEIVYEGASVKQIFYGTIPRTASAATVFKVLEETKGVHFRIEGKRVTVMP